MAESIRKSINKLTQTINSNTSQKSQTPFISKSKNQLETLINTPINSMVTTKSLEKPSLYQKVSSIASKKIQTTNSIFSFRNILFIVILILLLSLLGFNIFTYLSDGTNFLTNFFGPIFSTTGLVVGDATKNIVSTASTGTQKIVQTGSDTTKNIVGVAATGTTSSIDYLQDRLKKLLQLLILKIIIH